MNKKTAVKIGAPFLVFSLLAACGATKDASIPMFGDRPFAMRSSDRLLTDQELRDYAARRPSINAQRHQSQLGVHNGIPVIEAFYCGDICPLNTVRVIHYELPERQSCADVAGVDTPVRMPRRNLTYQNFCIPKGIRSPNEFWGLIID